jgi:threonyl-tRNA synthetase
LQLLARRVFIDVLIVGVCRAGAGQSVGKAIRAAEKDKIPVMCVVGQREAAAGTLAVRTYTCGDVGSMPADELVTRLSTASKNKEPL